MENEYYTPDVEDIFIGYDCQATNDSKHWYEWVFEESSFQVLKFELLNNMYRTPYLTKENVESEGWTNVVAVDDDGAFEATLYSHGLKYVLLWTTDNMLNIEERIGLDNRALYSGTCKSINEFKTIQKLLNIK